MDDESGGNSSSSSKEPSTVARQENEEVTAGDDNLEEHTATEKKVSEPPPGLGIGTLEPKDEDDLVSNVATSASSAQADSPSSTPPGTPPPQRQHFAHHYPHHQPSSSSAPPDYDYCAGVLPYSTFNNNVYFLLGKSRRHARLVSFSGKNEPCDADECETAAREFHEESLGAVMDRAPMLERVRSAPFVLKSKTPRGMPCTTFVVPVPHRRCYITAFHKTRRFITEMRMRTYELSEMSDIKWVCSRSFFTRIRRQWSEHGKLQSEDEWNRLMAFFRFSTSDTNSCWRRFVAPAMPSSSSDPGPSDTAPPASPGAPVPWRRRCDIVCAAPADEHQGDVAAAAAACARAPLVRTCASFSRSRYRFTSRVAGTCAGVVGESGGSEGCVRRCSACFRVL